MKISEEEKKENSGTSSVLDRPDYPYGLEINIDNDTFKKLGLKEAPKAGAVYMVLAKSTVENIHQSKHNNEDRITLTLQITDLDIKPEEKEDSRKTESVLYGE